MTIDDWIDDKLKGRTDWTSFWLGVVVGASLAVCIVMTLVHY